MTAYRWVWLTVAVPVLLVASLASLLLVEPSRVAATVVMCGGMAALLTIATREEVDATPAWRSAWRRAGRNGLLGGVASAALLALLAMLGEVALPVATVLGVTSPWAVRRLAARCGRAAPRRMSDVELCRAWRESSDALRSGPASEQLACVQQRQQYLDEMERRHPDRLGIWLAAGPEADARLEAFLDGRER